jgi:hypothetical protein
MQQNPGFWIKLQARVGLRESYLILFWVEVLKTA